MHLVVWNANMAAHRKLPTLIDRLHPDVLVLCECADQSTLADKYPGDAPWTSMEWAGRIPQPLCRAALRGRPKLRPVGSRGGPVLVRLRFPGDGHGASLCRARRKSLLG